MNASAMNATLPLATPPPVATQGLSERRRRARQRAITAYMSALSPRTRQNYLTLWQSFVTWCEDSGESYLPASPQTVADHLAERSETLTWGSLNVIKSAISFVHRTAQLDNPCRSALVRMVYSGLRRQKVEAGEAQQQAAPLTAEVLDAIEQTACIPRNGRGGNMETPHYARLRGHLDIAICRTMRDAGLRVSEAAALEWRDIRWESDGTGRLTLRRSKTDQEGKGAIRFLTKRTVAALQVVRSDRQTYGRYDETTEPRDKVFRLVSRAIYRHIQVAAQAAGLSGNYTAHSPRVGLAVELSRRGVATHRIQLAGGWQTIEMVARYTRSETAGRNAVAELLDE